MRKNVKKVIAPLLAAAMALSCTVYSYQQFPGTMDGFRVCKDDSECRNFF